MKKIHIVLLILIAGAIAVLISFLKTAATYETIAGAKARPGKFVHVAAKLDKSIPMDYDDLKDPNYLSFQAVDSSGDKMRVVYRKGKIENLEISERIVLEGRYEKDHFECQRVQTKCPSKYKDDMKAAEKNIQQTSQINSGPESNSAEK
jgi:cytochrome c-type biogenesis protein CcmE